MARNVSLRDLASRLNVATSTVSRALANDPGVSEERRREVQALAKALDYRPRPMRRQRTRNIGLVVFSGAAGTTKEQYLQGVVYHVERASSARGCNMHLSFVSADDSPDLLPAVVRERRVDAVIVCGAAPLAFCQALQEAQMPAVAMHDQAGRTGLPTVVLDRRQAVVQAAQDLASTGRRRVGLVRAPEAAGTIAAVGGLWADALAAVGLELDPLAAVAGVTDSVAGGRTAVEALIARQALPEALVFANDWMALGGIMALTAAGLQAPRDVSVIGHDNIQLGWELSPQLSTIDSSLNPSADEALAMLGMGEDEDPIDVELVTVDAPYFARGTWIPPKG